jgi:imidazolonepropionase-like amidohydrolase
MTDPQRDARRIAVVGATVVATDGGASIDDAMVLLDGHKFSWVGRRGERAIPDDARVVDAAGRWMIPGLVEGHCHVSGFASDAYHPGLGPFAAAPPVMEAFARHGITTVRDTGGPDLASMESLQHHDRPWPRFFGSGPNLDGLPGGPWKGIWKTEDPAEAERFVAREHEGGADFIKVYAWMKAPVMQAVVDESHRRGLRVAAHVGHAVTVEEAVSIGVDALEHVRVGPELLDDGQRAHLASLPPRYHDELASGAAWRFIDPDGPAVERIIRLLLEHHVYLTPTLVIHQRILQGTGDDHEDPADVGDPGSGLAQHEDAQGLVRERTEEEMAEGRLEFERICRFVGRAHQAGLRIVAGSDTPGPTLLPGASLHEELGLLTGVGLSPREALAAATTVPAALLGRSHHFGAIRPGLAADFVLLDADPLADIANVGRVASTWRDGRPLAPAT